MTHYEFTLKFNEKPGRIACNASHMTFGGRCLNCGYEPSLVTRKMESALSGILDEQSSPDSILPNFEQCAHCHDERTDCAKNDDGEFVCPVCAYPEYPNAVKVVIPRIHLNGTSAQDLLDEMFEAKHALDQAIEALQRATPNARDYYVIGPNAVAEAREGHEARMHKLSDVAAELNAIMEGIADQQLARTR